MKLKELYELRRFLLATAYLLLRPMGARVIALLR